MNSKSNLAGDTPVHRMFTRAQVECHISNLKKLLSEVGPEISKALTSLVLSKPTASRQEAIAFLADHLTQQVTTYTCN